MTKLIWLDLETTGLDSERGATILEIAVSVADIAIPFDATPVFHRVFGWSSNNALDPVVREMHTANGLLTECDNVWRATNQYGHAAAESDLLNALPPLGDEPPILAGSSIHFDRRFLRSCMPSFERVLSHRHFDVSSIKMFAQMLGMPKPPKGPGAHRAQGDILESIAHAREVAQWMVNQVCGWKGTQP